MLKNIEIKNFLKQLFFGYSKKTLVMYNNIPDFIECPYDPSHQITPQRIHYHLVKCQKNHPDTILILCPFNASHRIREDRKEEHIRVCPDKKYSEVFRANETRNDVTMNFWEPPLFESESAYGLAHSSAGSRAQSSVWKPSSNSGVPNKSLGSKPGTPKKAAEASGTSAGVSQTHRVGIGRGICFKRSVKEPSPGKQDEDDGWT